MTAPDLTPAPLPPERLAEIRERVTSRTAGIVEWLNRFSPVSGQEALENAEAVLEEDVPELLAEVDRLREFERRLTEEVEEFEDAAQADPNTPNVARLMIANLRHAMGGAS